MVPHRKALNQPPPRPTLAKPKPVRRSARISVRPRPGARRHTGAPLLISDSASDPASPSPPTVSPRVSPLTSSIRRDADTLSTTSTPTSVAGRSTSGTPVHGCPPTPPLNSEVLPSSWFHSALAQDKFVTKFVNRQVHACEIVDVASFQTEKLGFIDYLLRSSCDKLLDLGHEHYPQLTRMFYANVRVVKTSPTITLECQVKYTRFTLTEADLTTIFGLPTVHQPTLPQAVIRKQCLAEFANSPPYSPGATLSYLILHRDPRLCLFAPSFPNPTPVTASTSKL